MNTLVRDDGPNDAPPTQPQPEDLTPITRAIPWRVHPDPSPTPLTLPASVTLDWSKRGKILVPNTTGPFVALFGLIKITIKRRYSNSSIGSPKGRMCIGRPE